MSYLPGGPDHGARFGLRVCVNVCVAASVVTLAWLFTHGFSFTLAALLIPLLLVTGLLWDVRRMRPARTLSLKSAIQLYILRYIIYRNVKSLLKNTFEPASTSLRHQQTTYLLTLLRRYETTVYGRQYKFGNLTNVKQFVTSQPLTTYEHYKPYINRTLDDGEKNVMFTDETFYVAMTSGTTGPNKRFIITDYEARNCSKHFMLSLPGSVNLVPWRRGPLRKYCAVRLYVPPRVTSHGVRQGPVSYLARLVRPSLDTCTTPAECWDIQNDKSSIYVQVLFALYNRDCDLFLGAVPSAFALLFTTLEERIEELCEDIETGRIREDLDLDDNIRQTLNARLQPWPERGDEIRRLCRQGYHGVARRLWPELTEVVLIQDGAFAPLANSILDKHFYGVHRNGFSYSATEGNYGFVIPYDCYGNVWENCTVYAPNPAEGFFEFIPLDRVEDDQPETLLLDELEVGNMYELVVSNYRGLYRYRTHDVIHVIGHYNQIPLYVFCQRRGDVLNVTFEKTPQTVINACIQRTCEILNLKIRDYTTTESFNLQNVQSPGKSVLGDVEKSPGFYVLFVELDSDKTVADNASEVCDEVLCNLFENYASLRRRDQMRPLRLVQIQRGTFEKLTMKAVDENDNLMCVQFKLVKVLRNIDFLEFLVNHMNRPT